MYAHYDDAIISRRDGVCKISTSVVFEGHVTLHNVYSKVFSIVCVVGATVCNQRLIQSH